MSKNNLFTWSILVLLTIAGFSFAGQSGWMATLLFLCIATFVKVFLVAFQYMELKKAHPAWMLMVVFVLVVYVGVVIGLNS